MKNAVMLTIFSLAIISVSNCTKSPDKAIVGRWELVSQGCDDKGENCKKADTTIMQQFKEDGKCIRQIMDLHASSPSMWTYKVTDKHVKLSLYENDSVIKEFDIIDYGRNEMLIRWQFYSNCEKYKRI